MLALVQGQNYPIKARSHYIVAKTCTSKVRITIEIVEDVVKRVLSSNTRDPSAIATAIHQLRSRKRKYADVVISVKGAGNTTRGNDRACGLASKFLSNKEEQLRKNGTFIEVVNSFKSKPKFHYLDPID